MQLLLFTLLYFSLFYLIGIGGYRLYKILNEKIKGAKNGWQLAAFALLLVATCAFLLVGGLYAFIGIYRLLTT